MMAPTEADGDAGDDVPLGTDQGSDNDTLSNLTAAVDQRGDPPNNLGGFIDQFEITIGRTAVLDDEDRRHWLWRAKASTGESCISGTIFDAVMGVIEDVTGGEV